MSVAIVQNPQRIEIRKTRWQLDITITLPDGSLVELVASADSFFTNRDGIYFETREQFEKDCP